MPDLWEQTSVPVRLGAPGRPPELVTTARAPKRPSAGALVDKSKRAELLHTFFHHELQAAELMAFAILAFPEAPRAFRVGLGKILLDEVRHMGAYRTHMQRLGADVGDHPVRDWFWQRVPRCQTATQFVAMMGMGFEGANLDHTARFAAQFRAAGDEEGARLQEQIGEEEIPHVRFALHWFTRWTTKSDFASFRAELVPPLTPVVMRGPTLCRDKRARAGFSEGFMTALEAFEP
jgi:uncharacterized ferritin-like protein (DUF455 family)